MEDGKSNKPIEMPLRGRPRKRDADADSFPYGNMMQGYFDDKNIYNSQSFMGQVQFFKPQGGFQQPQDSMSGGYSKQQNHSSSSIHDDMMNLLGFEKPFPQKDNLSPGSVNEHSKPMSQPVTETRQDNPDVRLSDYLDPGSIKQMGFREYSAPQQGSAQFYGDQKDATGQKLPDFSSFINEFKVTPSKSLQTAGQPMGAGNQLPNRPFSENFVASFESPKSPYLHKSSTKGNVEGNQAPRSGEYVPPKQRNTQCDSMQNGSLYSLGRIGAVPGQSSQGFYNSGSPSSQNKPQPPQGAYNNDLFKSRYPFREGIAQSYPDNSTAMYPPGNTTRTMPACPEGFFPNSSHVVQNQEIEHDMHRVFSPRPGNMQPGYAPHPMAEMDNDGRLMASLFPGEHPAFRNSFQQGYQIPESVGQNSSSWMNRKKRKNNPLLWQYIKSNQTFHPSIIHPSKYSSLDFIQGVDNSQKMYLGSVKRASPDKSNGNSIFPLFLNSNKEVTDEFKGVVQNFRNSVNELDFNNVTVQQLKNLMKEFGLNHTGKKNELIERLQGILKKIDGKETAHKPEEQSQERPKELDDFGFYFF